MAVMPHAVLRAAAWPVETADAFAAPRLMEAASALLDDERRILARRESIIQRLYQAVPRFPARRARAYLLAVKRRVHGGVQPLSSPSPDVEAAIAGDPAVSGLLAEEQGLRAALGQVYEDFRRQFDRELARQLKALRNSTSDDRFRQALLVANPPAAAGWDRVLAGDVRKGESTRAKAVRHLETTIFGYLMRAPGRPTPFGLWAGVTVVSPAEAATDPLEIEPAPPAYVVSVNLAHFARVLEALASTARYRRRGRLRLSSPTIHRTGNAWWLHRLTDHGTKWIRLPARDDVRALISAFPEDEGISREALIEAVSAATDHPRASLDAALDDLIRLEAVEVDLALPPLASNVWEALECVTPLLLEEDRSRWIMSIAVLRGLSLRLAEELGKVNPTTAREVLGRIAQEIRSLSSWAGASTLAGEPVVYVDMGLPMSASWSENLRTRVEKAISELMSPQARDDSTEAVRRERLIRLLGPLAPPTEVAFVEAVFPSRALFGTGGRVAPLPKGTRMASNDAATTHRFSEEDLGCSVPVGPWGSVLVRLSSGANVWTGAVLPHAGMFATRYENVLSTKPGGAAVFREIEEISTRVGAPTVEVAGADTISPNAALRSALTPAVLGAHGGPGMSPEAASVVVDRAWRPWLRLSPNGPLHLPSYKSAATAGSRDPCSALLIELAAAAGGDVSHSRFSSRNEWSASPRLVLPSGAVMGPTRWLIDDETMRRLASESGAARYLAWVREVRRLRLPALAYIRVNVSEGEILMPLSSPLALRWLVERQGWDTGRGVLVSELPGPPELWPFVDSHGRHYASELAVTWCAAGWAKSGSPPSPSEAGE
jgi:hypothetical protein